ncbi:unnamed protein product [Adineta ricciae]|uniref:G-protein coupled receptors family 1 profile domain-containing protein n=1 Tax=Adineta ricciae TaxID=249248 RepID=A0A814L012_ADIRI|nr:unnamed protein product [Adineta ricciae]CAF1110692.1 unnamed protein product [Adineta ricciae]
MNDILLAIRTSSTSVNSILLAIPYVANIWLGTLFWTMGNIGCVGNLIVFRSKTFNNQAYTVYLLAETISDFFLVNLVLLTRILEKGFGMSIRSGYDYLCKIRQFSTYYFYVTSFTFFSMATIDRILSTQRSNGLRKWSNRVSLAYKLVFVMTILWLLILCHRLFIYKIQDGDCAPQFLIYDIIDNYAEAILMEICPLIIVFILVYFLRRSLRTVLQRQANTIASSSLSPSNPNKRSQLQQIDSQLTRMLMFHSIVAIISFVPYACQIFYSHITENWPKTPLQKAIEKISSQVTHIFAYLFFVSSFYASMTCNRGFRREIKRKFQFNKVRPSNMLVTHINTNG